MKKQVLFFTALLIGLATVTATEIMSVSTDEDLKITRYRYAQPIMFVERGVEFMIFPDGSFDFNTNMESDFQTSNSHYYRRSTITSRRSSINGTFGAPGTISRVQYSAPRSRGVIIEHDRDGKVRRIGNVFVNYDRSGKIKRAGSIYMSYKGNGTLRQVGGLHVNYNHWGEIVHTSGQVSPFRNACGICGVSGCTTNHNHEYDSNSNDDWDDGYTNDEDFYYYKQNGKVKKQKKIK